MLEIHSSSLHFWVWGNQIEGQETITEICSILESALVPADREDLIRNALSKFLPVINRTSNVINSSVWLSFPAIIFVFIAFSEERDTIKINVPCIAKKYSPTTTIICLLMWIMSCVIQVYTVYLMQTETDEVTLWISSF